MRSQPDEVDFSRIDQHPQGALLFIKIFMRFEFAMKEIGYCKPSRCNNVGVEWDRFVNDLLRHRNDFLEALRKEGTAKTLIERPPSHQVMEANGKLGWKKAAAPIRDCQSLFGAIRRVRNNLFHGGKSGDEDHDRNDSLIAESQHVLIEAMKVEFDLRMMFEGYY